MFFPTSGVGPRGIAGNVSELVHEDVIDGTWSAFGIPNRSRSGDLERLEDEGGAQGMPREESREDDSEY